MQTDFGPGAIVSSLAAMIAAFLSALLILSAAHKRLGKERATLSASDLLQVSGEAGRRAVSGAVAAELAAGFALILPATRLAGALMAAALWLLYFLVIQRAINAGRRDLDCGCSFGRAHAPLGLFEQARNLTLVLLAAGVALASGLLSPAPIPPADVLSAVALVALYLAADQAAALRRAAA